mmetsp:Transcript_36130/g.114892  ORF Transcript_36130/g.114892 Transcript_36130/m.114892 type:complete len:423 (-) Transcript_36130:77-1345(-)
MHPHRIGGLLLSALAAASGAPDDGTACLVRSQCRLGEVCVGARLEFSLNVTAGAGRCVHCEDLQPADCAPPCQVNSTSASCKPDPLAFQMELDLQPPFYLIAVASQTKPLFTFLMFPPKAVPKLDSVGIAFSALSIGLALHAGMLDWYKVGVLARASEAKPDFYYTTGETTTGEAWYRCKHLTIMLTSTNWASLIAALAMRLFITPGHDGFRAYLAVLGVVSALPILVSCVVEAGAWQLAFGEALDALVFPIVFGVVSLALIAYMVYCAPDGATEDRLARLVAYLFIFSLVFVWHDLSMHTVLLVVGPCLALFFTLLAFLVLANVSATVMPSVTRALQGCLGRRKHHEAYVEPDEGDLQWFYGWCVLSFAAPFLLIAWMRYLDGYGFLHAIYQTAEERHIVNTLNSVRLSVSHQLTLFNLFV